jgi:site-specific DNA-adenine methylase
MGQISPKPKILVEPFAGGGIISLTALFENLVERVVMVEVDDEIAAVWQSVVNGASPRISNAPDPHNEYTPYNNGRISNRQEFVMDG